MDKSHEINKIPFYELLTDEQKKEVLDHSKIKAFGKECRIAERLRIETLRSYYLQEVGFLGQTF